MPHRHAPMPHPSFDHHSHPSCNRRQWLGWASLAATAGWSASGWAQPGASNRGGDGERTMTVAQIIDVSANQQDVSHDFLIGSRVAWQEINARGGLRGRSVQHLTLETDGTAASAEGAWRNALQNPACVALSGCVGNQLAGALVRLQTAAAANGGAVLPMVAPWLHSNGDLNDSTFDIFPDHQEQIAHALKTLASMGVQQVGVVYANVQVQQQSRAHIAKAARDLRLNIQSLPLADTTGTNAAALRSPEAAIVLFIGGTPELHDFARQLVLKPGRQCYVVALADVNLQVLAQLRGVPSRASIIATQAVPLVTAALPVVRSYREALARLFDEPPSPQGLAGYIAARYTAEALLNVTGPITRANLLSSLQRRTDTQIGGYQIAFQGKRRISAMVTQSMLTQDGRIVG